MQDQRTTLPTRARICRRCAGPFTVKFPSSHGIFCSDSCSPWRHRLSAIEGDARQAVCKTCGSVKIWKSTTGWQCSQTPAGTIRIWVHRLLTIDPAARSGICEECGPVRIWRDGGPKWKCSVGARRLIDQTHYRRYLKPTCERCGFVPEDLCQLDINHRDGHHTNESPANLETLCANCHRLFSKRQRADWEFSGDRWIKPAI